MQQAQAIIERVKRVSPTIQRIDVALDRSQQQFDPGQFFLARLTESLDPYLREPWIPVWHEGHTITIERNTVQDFMPGQIVNLLGPLGKPIPMREGVRTLLLVAFESTPAALLLLAQNMLASGGSVALALLGRAVYYPLDVLPSEVEVYRGDSEGNWLEREEAVRWADQVVAVAPPPYDMPFYARLLQSIRDIRIDIPAGYAFGLVQPPMPCGVGACQACVVRCGSEELPACVNGPAFDLLSLTAVVKETE